MRTTFLLLACIVAATAQYKQVWSDEFNGNSLDLSKWQYEVNCDGGGNNELQCYTSNSANLKVSDGYLHITAVPQAYNGKKYTSARINTKASAAWKYGRFDARAKIPNGLYLWPALWMMPRDSVYGGWAASGEIDIMENHGGSPSEQQTTLHYGGSWPNNVYTGSGAQTLPFDMTADFHNYSVIWTPEKIQFLVDDSAFYEQTLQRNFWSGKGNNPYTTNGQPFNQYFYYIINLAIGGNFFGGNANALTSEQAANWASPTLVIDYVRVSQLPGNPVNVNPPPVPIVSCSGLWASLSCRTASQDPSQVNADAVAGARAWLCSTYPQNCTLITNGALYTVCNSVEQLSYAMSQYYNAVGPTQGSDACAFGGIGHVNNITIPYQPTYLNGTALDNSSPVHTAPDQAENALVGSYGTTSAIPFVVLILFAIVAF